jgi:hypothetical protein
MYHALGLGWGNSLLGFIALALAPLPFWISKQLSLLFYPKGLMHPMPRMLTFNLAVAKGEWMRKTWELKDL